MRRRARLPRATARRIRIFRACVERARGRLSDLRIRWFCFWRAARRFFAQHKLTESVHGGEIALQGYAPAFRITFMKLLLRFLYLAKKLALSFPPDALSQIQVLFM